MLHDDAVVVKLVDPSRFSGLSVNSLKRSADVEPPAGQRQFSESFFYDGLIDDQADLVPGPSGGFLLSGQKVGPIQLVANPNCH